MKPWETADKSRSRGETIKEGTLNSLSFDTNTDDSKDMPSCKIKDDVMLKGGKNLGRGCQL